jgi:hypothetical protein
MRTAPNEFSLGLTDPAPILPGANTSAKTCCDHPGLSPRPIIPSPMRQYNTGTIEGSAERLLRLEIEKIVNRKVVNLALAAKKDPLNRSANEWKERF